MASEREIKKQQEESLFDNILALELLKKGNSDSLTSYLEMINLRLISGMTAEEIDAVAKRAKEASKKY